MSLTKQRVIHCATLQSPLLHDSNWANSGKSCLQRYSEQEFISLKMHAWVKAPDKPAGLVEGRENVEQPLREADDASNTPFISCQGRILAHTISFHPESRPPTQTSEYDQ